MAACVGAAALCVSAFAAPRVAAADFFEAYEAFQRGDYEEARAIWSTLAYDGDVDAQFNLGALYENGLGVEKDAETAARWYRRRGIASGGPRPGSRWRGCSARAHSNRSRTRTRSSCSKPPPGAASPRRNTSLALPTTAGSESHRITRRLRAGTIALPSRG